MIEGSYAVPRQFLPSLEQVSQLPSLVSVQVMPDWIDVNGHMNIRHYLEIGSKTTVAGVESCGIDQRYRDEERASIFDAETHIRYLNESHIGDELTGHLRFVDVGPKSVHTVVLVVDYKREVLVNVYESLGIHVNMETRRATNFPDHIFKDLEMKVQEDLLLDWLPPVSDSLEVRGGIRALQTQAAR